MDKPWDDRHVLKHTTFVMYTFVLYGRKLYTLTLTRFLYTRNMAKRTQEVKKWAGIYKRNGLTVNGWANSKRARFLAGNIGVKRRRFPAVLIYTYNLYVDH